jgi:hypothetical protein
MIFSCKYDDIKFTNDASMQKIEYAVQRNVFFKCKYIRSMRDNLRSQLISKFLPSAIKSFRSLNNPASKSK